eukprot:1443199-Prymnesium_polylepis.1
MKKKVMGVTEATEFICEWPQSAVDLAKTLHVALGYLFQMEELDLCGADMKSGQGIRNAGLMSGAMALLLLSNTFERVKVQAVSMGHTAAEALTTALMHRKGHTQLWIGYNGMNEMAATDFARDLVSLDNVTIRSIDGRHVRTEPQ